MEEKRNWWEEGLRMKGANFGEVVEEKNSIQNEWLMVFLVLFFFTFFSRDVLLNPLQVD